MRKAFGPWCLFLLLVSCGRQPVQQNSVSTSPNSAVVNNIGIRGYRRVSLEAIKANIHTQPGSPLNEATMKGDVERLRSLNEIDDVSVTDETDSSGVRTLIFNVSEKPPVK